jgi:hypothetical protein
MTLTQVLLDEAEATYAVVQRLVRRVSDDELSWKPSEGHDWMTMGQLLMHLASFGCGKAVQAFVTGKWPGEAQDGSSETHVPPAAALPTVLSVQEALDLLVEDRRVTLSSIAAAGEPNLLARRITAPWGGGELSLFQQLLEMLKHLAQHKGQLFYYLKLMGKTVDSRDLWGGGPSKESKLTKHAHDGAGGIAWDGCRSQVGPVLGGHAANLTRWR